MTRYPDQPPTSPYAHLDTAAPKDGWIILGPGGGGCVHLLTVSPHWPDTLLVSSDMTAGFITHDGGRRWRQFNLKSRLYAFAFDPKDPNVIYAGSSGLFRSEDHGFTWRMLFPDPAAVQGEARLGDESNHAFLSGDNWPGGTVHAILVDPDQPAHLFIVIQKQGARQPEDDFYGLKKDGMLVFVSVDRGLTWEERARLSGSEIHRMALDPGSPVGSRTLFVFTGQGVARLAPGDDPELLAPGQALVVRHASCSINPITGQTVFFLSTVTRPSDGSWESAIWKSTDLGRTWQACREGLQNRLSAAPPVFSQVSACDRDARRVYLIAEKFPELDEHGRQVDCYGILRSCDEGQTWAWVVKMDDQADPPNRRGGWAEQDYGAGWGDIQGEAQISPKGRFAWDVVVSPVDPDVCYTMDFSTIFRTADGGAAWDQLVTNLHHDGTVSSRGIDVLGVYDVVFDPFDPRHIALPITDVGVFHSFNRGRTWRHALAGVPRRWINSCYAIVFDPHVRGRAWSAWSAVHDIPRLKIFDETLLNSGQGGICRTDDGLQTWRTASRGLPTHALCTHLALDLASPSQNRTLYAAVFGQGVYRSVDGGTTWTAKNQGIDPGNRFAWRLAHPAGGTLYLVIVKNQVRGKEYAGALYHSLDQAESWQPVALPEDVDFPNDLVCSADGWLYLACWPRVSAGRSRGGGAYGSADGGRTWKCLFDPTAHVYSITIDPADAARLYLATFDAGAYHSDDRGRTWQRLRGYNFQWCYRVIPDPHAPGMLYLTTFGSSLWYGPVGGVPGALEDISDGQRSP